VQQLRCGELQKSYRILQGNNMTFTWLEEINSQPAIWSAYTAADLWTDPHISKQMLAFHLNDAVDLASRRSEFIKESVPVIVDRFDVREGMSVADFGCGPGLYTTRLAAIRLLVGRRVRHRQRRSVEHMNAAISPEPVLIDAGV